MQQQICLAVRKLSVTTLLAKSRSYAYYRQDGRCCYCDYPMWVSSAPRYAKLYGCSIAQAELMKCTAEHLVAKQDDGNDGGSNIAAACKVCNQRRHNRKHPPSPQTYREMVQRKLRNGGWHPFQIAGL
ncbi:HNH endonuclease [Pseudomonas fluorescens BBc6R8]|uniref:HNH endonuclease n=1 Tax=Pseudomonas fluorescens TaxID=294 RepID=UPI001269A710|nr:HNH endonuclease [Pseudomonas fluorescens]QQD55387.1 HNH endonuclease [Pseudomonas fluorescens BBc6R8]